MFGNRKNWYVEEWLKIALIKCEDCGKEFSDKANACPNCGCPPPRKITKILVHRVRYPSGFLGMTNFINREDLKIYIDNIDYGNIQADETKEIECSIGKHLFKVDYTYDYNGGMYVVSNNITKSKTREFEVKENEEFVINLQHFHGHNGFEILFGEEVFDEDDDDEPREEKVKGINC